MLEHFNRQPEDSWLLRLVEGLGATLHIASLNCAIRLSEIYRLIEFPVVKDETEDELNT